MSFDVPYPPDYGGAIDVFYKLKALSEAGCSIYLHCFEYGRGRQNELERYCEQVWYYPRNTAQALLHPAMPYIVASRSSAVLADRLKSIKAPIFFEGVHTTFCLNDRALAERFKAIRLHNIEHDYFRQLGISETRPGRKMIYKIESLRLKRYEHSLHHANAFFPVSVADKAYFEALYPAAIHQLIPPFQPYGSVTVKEGSGNYALYHGNLSHPENIQASLFLLREVIPHAGIPFIIAGKQPAPEVVAACASAPLVTLIADPSQERMDELIASAQALVLPTFQQSGVKLKLLASLFRARHIIVNSAMLFGTGLPDECCIKADTAADMLTNLKNVMHQPFTAADILKRRQVLAPYDNQVKAQKLLASIPF